ncbi:hypothetical protein ACTXG6_07305 [Pseudonocardia sp. Cha107L01]|uniref:hypothetical protein n=1 Tax=Pseudonocardia sp. Cha107L01 TaxID=3457576 RepID=UPI00403EEC49
MNTTEVKSTRRLARRWPLLLLAAPAAVSIWAGWVGLGTMAGFGLVHPLPGIADGFQLNSAITLPIGVEAYSAYALGTWLTTRPMPATARRFAGWSSLVALLLGLVGQVVYHVLTTRGLDKAPLSVVVFVACLPVLVLGAGATLHHLLGDDTAGDETVQGHSTVRAEAVVGDDSGPAPEPVAAPQPPALQAPRPKPKPARRRAAKKPTPRPTVENYLIQVRAQLTPGVEPTAAWCRQATGCGVSTSHKLAAALAAERMEVTNPPMSGTTARGQEAAA